MYRLPEILHGLDDAECVAGYLEKFSEQATTNGTPLHDRMNFNLQSPKRKIQRRIGSPGYFRENESRARLTRSYGNDC